MIRGLSACLPALAVMALVAPAQAQETGQIVKPILDLRLRAEEVDQDGLDSTLALTLAGRFGLDAKFTNGWGALIEGEAVGHLTSDFSDTVDTVPGKARKRMPRLAAKGSFSMMPVLSAMSASARMSRPSMLSGLVFPASGMSVWTMYISTRCSAFLATRALRGSSKAIPILCMPALRPQSATLC